jgi:hypothetical protein
MKNDFSIICPNYQKVCNFVEDDWHDELIDSRDDHLINCLHCGKELNIRVHAIYKLEVLKSEDEEDE